MNKMKRLSTRLGLIPLVCGIGLFVLAAVLYAWPTHAKAITGIQQRGDSVTVDATEVRSCPYRLDIGYVRNHEFTAAPAGRSAVDNLESLFFAHNCEVERANRESGVIVCLAGGAALTAWAGRRQRQASWRSLGGER
jgi:hypothetical protein